MPDTTSDNEKTPVPTFATAPAETAPAAPADDGRKTVEAWAQLKIPAFLTPWQERQSKVTDKREWHREMWLAATKAIRGWPAERRVTEAEFDEALKDAQQIKIG